MIKKETRTKAIVRILPFTLSESDFKETIGEFLEHIDYFSYFLGKKSRSGREFHSRAYLNFVSVQALFEFAQKFDGYIFKDEKGLDQACQVECAPFQGRLKLHSRQSLDNHLHPNIVHHPKSCSSKVDPLLKTIENDADFFQFLEELKSPPTIPPPERISIDPSKITPLVEELKQQAINKAKAWETRIANRERHKNLKKTNHPNSPSVPTTTLPPYPNQHDSISDIKTTSNPGMEASSVPTKKKNKVKTKKSQVSTPNPQKAVKETAPPSTNTRETGQVVPSEIHRQKRQNTKTTKKSQKKTNKAHKVPKYSTPHSANPKISDIDQDQTATT